MVSSMISDRLLQSQAVKAGGFVFLAGQVPTDSQARVVPGTMAEKAHKMFQNTKIMLEAAGTGFDKVVKVTVRTSDDDLGNPPFSLSKIIVANEIELDLLPES